MKQQPDDETAIPLLKTKLYIPPIRTDLVPRPRLVERLKAGLRRKLTLISAPAGYGKTTLLVQFTVDAPLPVVWYQLDVGDNDPAVFFEYLVACIAGRYTEFGTAARSVLQNTENITAQWQRFLVVLTNEIMDTVAEDFLLVLEDYHVIDNPLIHAFVDGLIAQSPPRFHLVLSTRSDPLISLARLRARRQVTEIRLHDLRFTTDEVRSLLAGMADFDLPAEGIEALVQETEGWATALQLVLSSPLRRQGDSAQSFIEAMHGTSRYIFDFLSEEVLAAQTPEVQSFLLGSSILELMTPPLCDELLGITDSEDILRTLEARNLFTVALDDHREWFRYQYLFREFLQEELYRQKGEDVRALHLRAAAHLKVAGDTDQAISHYQAAGATDKLADLIEEAAPDLLARGRVRTVQQWLDIVPDGVLADRPWLTLYHGMIMVIQGQVKDARMDLTRARDAFAVAGDELGESRVLNQLSRVAAFEGHYGESLELNHEALRRMPWADHEGRGQALREQAELWLYLGNSTRAIQAMEESLVHAQYLGDLGVLADRTISQGVAYCISGRLTEAKRTLERGLNMLETSEAYGVHIAHLHLGDGHFERWELSQAIEHYQQSLALSQRFQDSTSIVYAHCALGAVYTESEELDQAQTHLDAALAILEQTGMRSLPAEATWSYLAEWHVRAGRYTQAEACSHKAIAIRSSNVPNAESDGVWHAIRGEESGRLAWGMGWLPLAKVYSATGRYDQAEKVLLSVEAASEAGGITPSLINSAFHLSLLYLETGREEAAISHIRLALTAAAPEGHRWVYLGQGGEAVPVLIQALKHKIEPAFTQTLLRQLGESANSALTELLAHSDAEVRRSVREILPSEGTQRLGAATAVVLDETLRVTCFGDFKVTYASEEVGEPGWLATKAGHLFAYFITFRNSRVPRDRILEALWPEMRPDRSSGAFHTALYKMRQMLRSAHPGEFVQAQSGEYHVERELFRIDVDEFLMLNAQSSGHRHESIERCEPCIERLRRAVNLYQGDYLENLYYDWTLDEQRRLQEMYLKALRALAEHHALQGDHETAITHYRQILDNDPLLEDIHCQIMRTYGRLGDRSGVMQQYRRLQQILADELGVEPMPETQGLYRALMDGQSR